MYRLLKALKRDEKGATAIEYGLILALVFLAIVIAVTNFASRTNAMWYNVSNKVTST